MSEPSAQPQGDEGAPGEPRYPYLVVDVDAALEDEASALLFDLGASGVETRDDTTLVKGAGHGLVTLVASFSERENAEAARVAVDPAWAARIENVVGDAWRDAWKEHFRPFELTPRITVCPPWERYVAVRKNEIVLELEPGRAFGTGLHATTRLVAETLDALATLAGASVLDVGTGSGILGLVALALGAASVLGIDVDADAVAAARENAVRNHMGDRFQARATPIESIEEVYPVVVANIEARVLVPMADVLGARVAPSGVLILSGILVEQADEVERAYPSFARSERRTLGEWVALVMRRAG